MKSAIYVSVIVLFLFIFIMDTNKVFYFVSGRCTQAAKPTCVLFTTWGQHDVGHGDNATRRGVFVTCLCKVRSLFLFYPSKHSSISARLTVVGRGYLNRMTTFLNQWESFFRFLVSGLCKVRSLFVLFSKPFSINVRLTL